MQVYVALRDRGKSIDKFKTFRHRRESFTIWLKPEPQEPLMPLHEAIWKASMEDERLPRRCFQPHLSVGQVQGKTKMEQLIAELQSAWKPLEFTLDGVSLLFRGEPADDVFRVADMLLLWQARGI